MPLKDALGSSSHGLGICGYSNKYKEGPLCIIEHSPRQIRKPFSYYLEFPSGQSLFLLLPLLGFFSTVVHMMADFKCNPCRTQAR